jgi:hypothetical protein
MVAKSYQSLQILDEPYVINGRTYVHVATKTGTQKQVRWYSDYEYRKMYPNDPVNEQKVFKTQKQVLGFDNGYITIFKGNTYEDKEYFKLNSARYHKLWGWYFVSTEELPDDLPEDVEPVRLNWSEVGNDDDTLKNESEVSAAVERLIYGESTSEYVGSIGEKVEVYATVDKVVNLDGYYGPSTMHIMHGDDDNVYVWTTAARSWEVGTEHHIIGTIKDHKTYRGVRQTVLTRCRELG